jgi:hypothetical protein
MLRSRRSDASTNTVAACRQKPDHPLRWELVAGRFVRYRAGDVKVYLAGRRAATPPPRRREA